MMTTGWQLLAGKGEPRYGNFDDICFHTAAIRGWTRQILSILYIRENCKDMAIEFTYHEIEFRISVKEGFYHYNQKVSPAYRVDGTGVDWVALVVHRLPGRFRVDQWFVSELNTGSSIEIPRTTSRDKAVEHAISKIQQMGKERYQKALKRTQTRKEKSWRN